MFVTTIIYRGMPINRHRQRIGIGKILPILYLNLPIIYSSGSCIEPGCARIYYRDVTS